MVGGIFRDRCVFPFRLGTQPAAKVRIDRNMITVHDAFYGNQ